MKKIKISKKYIDELYNSHVNGKSISLLSKESGFTRSILTQNFISNKLKIIKRSYFRKKYKKITNDELCFITQLYSQNKSLSEISKLTGIVVSQIKRKLNKIGISTNRTNFNYRERLRTYTINEDFFNKIDSPEKAYVLGFLYADGNANKKSSQITLKLQEQDKYILEKISLLIGSNKPLHFHIKKKNTHQNQFSLKITNKIMYENLISLGVVPNKTFTIKFPNYLIDSLTSHFIRGYFDGDGCLYLSKIRGQPSWSIIGSTEFCNSISKIFLEKFNIKSYLSHDKRCKNGIDILRIRKYNDVKTICEWMYTNSNIHLNRKYNKFIKMKEIKMISYSKLGNMGRYRKPIISNSSHNSTSIT